MAFFPKDKDDDATERERIDSEYSFTHKYDYTFGTIYTRGHKLEKCDLFKALKAQYIGYTKL